MKKQPTLQLDALEIKIIKALEYSAKMLVKQKKRDKQNMAISENGSVKIINYSQL